MRGPRAATGWSGRTVAELRNARLIINRSRDRTGRGAGAAESDRPAECHTVAGRPLARAAG